MDFANTTNLMLYLKGTKLLKEGVSMNQKTNLLQAIKNRISNYGFWVSLFALIPLASECFGGGAITGNIPENYQEITALFLSLLVALGVTNNPTTQSKWYFDDKGEKETNKK